MSNDKITVDWEVYGQGTIEIYPEEVEGMTPDEIESWVREGAELEVMEQGKWGISLSGMTEALRKIKEADHE